MGILHGFHCINFQRENGHWLADRATLQQDTLLLCRLLCDRRGVLVYVGYKAGSHGMCPGRGHCLERRKWCDSGTIKRRETNAAGHHNRLRLAFGNEAGRVARWTT